MTPDPIFIGGLFKSGTTLLRSLISQHSRIASGLETYWFDLDWSGPRDGPFAERVEMIRAFYDLSQADMEGLLAAPTAEAFLDGLMTRHARTVAKDRWAEKTPGNILHVERILAAWPEARIVQITRDPRDVLASLREALEWDSIDAFMERWIDFLGTADRAKRAGLLPTANYLEIRYEDLIRDSETTMRAVMTFVGEPFEPAVSLFEGSATEFNRVRAVTGKESSTLKRLQEPMSAKRIGIWRDILVPDDVAALHAVAESRGLGAVMRDLEVEG